MQTTRMRCGFVAVALIVLPLFATMPRREACGAESAAPDPDCPAAVGTVRVVDRQHADDVISLDAEVGGLLVRVRSARGIGRCTLAAERGRWPAAITIVLEGFPELEDFEISAGSLHARGGRRESGRLARFTVPVGDIAATAPAVLTPVGVLDVHIEKIDSGVRVTLPRDLLRDVRAEQATIRWVDWLRR